VLRNEKSGAVVSGCNIDWADGAAGAVVVSAIYILLVLTIDYGDSQDAYYTLGHVFVTREIYPANCGIQTVTNDITLARIHIRAVLARRITLITFTIKSNKKP